MVTANHTTLNGMICNASDTLDKALDPKAKGIPRKLFEMCKGIVLVNSIETGFIFSGHEGTGIVMAKREDGSWSNPSAVGLTGGGFGLIAGHQTKNIMVLIMDKDTMKVLSGRGHWKLGASGGIAAGPVGRESVVALDVSEEGACCAFSYTFTEGVWAGVAIQSSIIGALFDENNFYYNREVSPRDILFGEEELHVPSNSGIPELHAKLRLLAEGKTSEPSKEEEEQKSSRREAADEVAESLRPSQPSLVKVDAKEEAEKEAGVEPAAAK